MRQPIATTKYIRNLTLFIYFHTVYITKKYLCYIIFNFYEYFCFQLRKQAELQGLLLLASVHSSVCLSHPLICLAGDTHVPCVTVFFWKYGVPNKDLNKIWTSNLRLTIPTLYQLKFKASWYKNCYIWNTHAFIYGQTDFVSSVILTSLLNMFVLQTLLQSWILIK